MHDCEEQMTLTTERMKLNMPGAGEFECYVAKPEKLPAPAVIVIQEIFGITDFLKATCDNLAREGFVAVAPDLFWRMEPGVVLNPDDEKEFQHALGLYQKFKEDEGVSDLQFVLDQVRKMPEVKGKVGCVGYCLGGKLVYLMACRSTVDCGVGYYGVGIEQQLDESKNIKNPLMLHFAEEDKFVPKDAQKTVKEALAENSNVTFHFYPGMDHGFARLGGHSYSAEAAQLANSRTAEFFKKELV